MPRPIEVPYTDLAPDTLRRLIESIVLREGTDYGARERSLEEKVTEVMGRLRRGEAQITFDLESRTADIVDTNAIERANRPIR